MCSQIHHLPAMDANTLSGNPIERPAWPPTSENHRKRKKSPTIVGRVGVPGGEIELPIFGSLVRRFFLVWIVRNIPPGSQIHTQENFPYNQAGGGWWGGGHRQISTPRMPARFDGSSVWTGSTSRCDLNHTPWNSYAVFGRLASLAGFARAQRFRPLIRRASPDTGDFPHRPHCARSADHGEEPRTFTGDVSGI